MRIYPDNAYRTVVCCGCNRANAYAMVTAKENREIACFYALVG
jgi:hypothetical protein